MKTKFILSLIIFLGAHAGLFAQADSVQLKNIKKDVAQLKAALEKKTPCVNCYADTTRVSGFIYNENGHFVYSARTLSIAHWTLILLPVIIFGVTLIVILALLNKTDFNLADAMSENFTITVDVPNPKADPKNNNPVPPNTPPTVPVTTTPRSASRLVAFLSGFGALTIGICATSYYFYMYLKTGVSPNLDNLFNILLGLGFGVVPYAVNRVSAAFKN